MSKNKNEQKNAYVFWDKAKENFLARPVASNLIAAAASVAIGLLFGFIVLLFINSCRAAFGISSILLTGFSSANRLAKVLYQAAPLIMTGLSVGFAFKTGLFNIGATGQYTVGSMFALIAALVFKMPWWACMAFAMIGGAIWGAVPGLFKALLNVNEVITSIMFNWIGLYTVTIIISNIPRMLANAYGATNADRTAGLAVANPSAVIPTLGLDRLLGSNFMNVGIFIAVIFSVIAFIILSKTTFGFELRACGLNRNAARYAGVNAKRDIILSMTIAGALAGVGGGLYYLSGIAEFTLIKSLLAMGFNGIPVALLGASNPLAIIISGLFVSYIQVGGEAMQPSFTKEIVDIIISAIIYTSALSLFIKDLLSKISGKRGKRGGAGALSSGQKDVQAGDGGHGILPPKNAEEELP